MGSSLNFVKQTTSLETNTDNQLQKKLLLIENDAYLSQAFIVNENQYQTQVMRVGESISEELKNHITDNQPNMILLDVGLSDSLQLLIIRKIRTFYDGLLVVVSSNHSDQEELEVFDLGADDYLFKSIDSRILMKRIQGLFRRQSNKASLVDLASMTSGDVCLQPKSQKCFVKGEGVKLTTFEFKLLKSLVEHQGRILSRDDLYNTLLKREYNGVERTLDVRMSQLREKLTGAGMKHNQIETVWGQGYMFSQI